MQSSTYCSGYCRAKLASLVLIGMFSASHAWANPNASQGSGWKFNLVNENSAVFVDPSGAVGAVENGTQNAGVATRGLLPIWLLDSLGFVGGELLPGSPLWTNPFTHLGMKPQTIYNLLQAEQAATAAPASGSTLGAVGIAAIEAMAITIVLVVAGTYIGCWIDEAVQPPGQGAITLIEGAGGWGSTLGELGRWFVADVFGSGSYGR